MAAAFSSPMLHQQYAERAAEGHVGGEAAIFRTPGGDQPSQATVGVIRSVREYAEEGGDREAKYRTEEVEVWTPESAPAGLGVAVQLRTMPLPDRWWSIDEMHLVAGQYKLRLTRRLLVTKQKTGNERGV